MSYQSDAIILEYLGNVATVAQRRLPPGARSRLVEQLRSQINSERERGPDTPEAVRRIIGRIGSPEKVVGREARRAADVGGGDPADNEPMWRTGTSRDATVARQIGFHADTTPITAGRGGEVAPPVSGGPLWQRPGTDTVVAPDDPEPEDDDTGLVGAPAYPVGVAPVVEDDDEDDDEPAPPPPPGVLRSLGTVSLVRELFALVLLAGGAVIRSAVLVILGLVVASTCLEWTDKQKRLAQVTIPVGVVLGFLVGTWAHAHGWIGDDVDGGTAGRRFFELAPIMFQVSGALAGVYLLVMLVRGRRS